MAADDKLAALEQLAKLRADGILTEAEFAAEKAAVLAGRVPAGTVAPTPAYAPSPVAPPPTIVYAAPPPRRRWYQYRFGRFALIGLMVGLVLEVPKYIPRGEAAPGEVSVQLPACDSAVARETLTNALEHNAAERVVNLQVLDIANMIERSYDPAKPTRSCTADVTLNSGEEHIGYDMRLNSDRSSVILKAYSASIADNSDHAVTPRLGRRRDLRA